MNHSLTYEVVATFFHPHHGVTIYRSAPHPFRKALRHAQGFDKWHIIRAGGVIIAQSREAKS